MIVTYLVIYTRHRCINFCIANVQKTKYFSRFSFFSYFSFWSVVLLILKKVWRKPVMAVFRWKQGKSSLKCLRPEWQVSASASASPASAPRAPCVPPPPAERSFRLLTDELYEKLEQSPRNVFNFYGCNNISLDWATSACSSKTTTRRKRVIISDTSDSSQDLSELVAITFCLFFDWFYSNLYHV